MNEYPMGGDAGEWPGQVADLIQSAEAGDAEAACALLSWLKDLNWPGAIEAAKYLKRSPGPAMNGMREILRGDDSVWKHWVMCFVIDGMSVEFAEQLVPELVALTHVENDADVAIEAAMVLCRRGLCPVDQRVEIVERAERLYPDLGNDHRDLREALEKGRA